SLMPPTLGAAAPGRLLRKGRCGSTDRWMPGRWRPSARRGRMTGMLDLSPRTPPDPPGTAAAPAGADRPALVAPFPSASSGPFARFMESWLPLVLALVSAGVGWQAAQPLGFQQTV